MANAAGGSGRLSHHDVVQLSEQIAGLSDAGLPLPSGLRALAEELPSRRLRAVLNAVSGSLEGGSSLDAALETQGGRLPSHLRGLVVAGLRTGRLGGILGRFVTYANFGSDLRQSLWLSLAYPIIAWVLAIGILGFLLTSLTSSFRSIFKDFGLSIPWMTRLLFDLAQIVSEFSRVLPWALGAIVLVALLTALGTSGPQRYDLVARIPLLGWVWRFSSLAEFCHLLALLLESEVSLGDALTMTGEGVNDAGIDRACHALRQDIDSGLSLSQAVFAQRFFPIGLARVLEWAEAHHSLPEALHMVGEMFESRAKTYASFTSTVCNVLTVIMLLLGICLTVGAILIPMIVLIRRLS